METPANAMNGPNTVNTRNQSQNSRFRRDWKENVLSLDGGGIRGYAALRILDRIMVEVRIMEKEDNAKLRTAHSLPEVERERDPLTTKNPLPCHYFDYVVGTSTGGLIAIMLGRLRMTVVQCSHEYKILGNSVFGHRRLLHYYRYSHKKLESSVKDVVMRNCTDPGSAGHGDDMMYQDDGDGKTCRTAVLAVEKRKKQDDELHAFTSYYSTPHHEQTLGRGLNPGNPKRVYIRDAARATSAAPGFFQEADVNGNVYMDGAMKANNPSRWAWDEAWRKYPEHFWQTANGHDGNSHNGNGNGHNGNGHGNGHGADLAHELSETNRRIGVFVSIGTGLRAPQSAFHRGDPLRSIRALLRKAVSNMTDCEAVHKSMEALAEQHHCEHYYRFNPPDLENMRLDQCLSRNRTFHTMDTACNEYLKGNEVQRLIRECAAELVRQRRSRCPVDELLQFHDLTIPGPRRW